MKPIQLEIKTYEELKEELGNEYDTAMYEINISALKEIEKLNRHYKMLEELNNANYESFVEANKVINELKDFLTAYENNRDSFKWNEQDYIDTIEKIEEIIGE